MNPYLRGGARPLPLVVCGHRGAMGLAPENTLESFELAFDLGADMVELDVHLSKDGVAVVVHDDSLERTTDVRARLPGRRVFVSDLKWSELQELDAGRWFVEQLEKRGPLPGQTPTEDERKRWLDAKALARFASGKVRLPSLAQVLGGIL